MATSSPLHEDSPGVGTLLQSLAPLGKRRLRLKQLGGHGCSVPQLQLMVQMEKLHVAAGGLMVWKFAFTQWRCPSSAGGEGKKKGSERAGGLKWKYAPKCASGWLGHPGKPLQQPPALLQVYGWLSLLVGKVEPVAAVPALTVFQKMSQLFPVPLKFDSVSEASWAFSCQIIYLLSSLLI